MEHLVCLTPDDLNTFIEITKMEILSKTDKEVILKGHHIFTYVFDYVKQMYCFSMKGVKI